MSFRSFKLNLFYILVVSLSLICIFSIFFKSDTIEKSSVSFTTYDSYVIPYDVHVPNSMELYSKMFSAVNIQFKRPLHYPAVLRTDSEKSLVKEISNDDYVSNTEEYDNANREDDFYLKSNSKFKIPGIVSLKKLLTVCVEAAKEGGVMLKNVHKKFERNKYSNMSVRTPKTLVQHGRMLSHKAILNVLKTDYPHIKVVSRKIDERNNTEDDLDASVFSWFQNSKISDDILVPAKNIAIWFDPLDGEYQYKRNYLKFVTTMICAAIKGKPVIGVIHQPFEDNSVWGIKGKGVYTSNDPSIDSSVSRSLATIIMNPKLATEFQQLIRVTYGEDVQIITASGAGYQSVQVLEGVADVYIQMSSMKKWKTCAGHALMEAMDGKMTTLNGSIIDYGKSSNVLNEGGVVASLLGHDIYFDWIKLMQDFSGSSAN